MLDDYSRYVIAWRLFTGMAAEDVQELLDEAIAKTGVDQVPVPATDLVFCRTMALATCPRA